MNLQSAIALRRPLSRRFDRIQATGTSEGAVKGWDTRGRGRKPDHRDFTLPNGRTISVSWDRATQDAQLERIRAEEMAKLPPNVQNGLKSGVTTKQMFTKDGQYTPERMAVHADIINKLTANAVAQAQPHLAIVAGGAASGKSAAAEMVMGEHSDSVNVNTDIVRSMLPEAGALVGNDQQGMLQDEAGDVRDMVLARSMEARSNVVLDAPGSAGVVKLGGQAEQDGYTVSVDYVHRDVLSAMSSAAGRKYRADALSDLRDVPSDVVFNSHVKARGALASLSNGRALRVWDNEGGRDVVFRRDADGKVQVYNQDRLGVISHGQNDRLPEIPDSTFQGS